MLGPALKELLVDLERRKAKLSKFERAIHRELVGILLADHIETSIMGVVDTGPRVPVIGSTSIVAVAVPGHYLRSSRFREAMQPPLGVAQNLTVEVDLSGGDWRDSPGMQIGCGEKKCRYKEPEPEL